MIKRFFHNLNSLQVTHILISGQATVLYGAATFSEDIDLWVEPKFDNWNKFLKVLKNMNAKVYKLTPSVSMELIRKGHGYHFQIPSKDEKSGFWFLDVMGLVPRVSSFKNCLKNVNNKKTEWGNLPVMGIRDLVEIKKTRRLEDYPVISNLVRIEYENLLSKKIENNDWKWILRNSFNIEDILYYLNLHNVAKTVSADISRKCLPFCLKAAANPEKEEYILNASNEIALEVERLRQQDRKYWNSVINELKDLKQNNQLLPIGSKPPYSTTD